MIKRFEYELSPNEDIRLIDFYNREKTAAVSSELQQAIDSIKPDPSKSYILLNAMGTTETWGQNKNGDIWKEADLKSSYKTFEKAGVYEHHQNKDINKSVGQVKFAYFNDEMQRVELLVEVDKKKAKHITDKIAADEKLACSMGGKVKYDICSNCGNKSKTASDYCSCIKTMKNRVLPHGVKIGMINPAPINFFDISFVTVPADRTAYNLMKIANAPHTKLSAELGEEWLKENHLKESDIDKRLDVSPENTEAQVLSTKNKKLQLPEELPGDLPESWLKQATQEHQPEELLSAMAYTRIMPTPRDFQYIVFSHMNKEAAQALYDNRVTFTPIEHSVQDSFSWNTTEKAIEKCAECLESHSLNPIYIAARQLSKLAEITQAPLLENNLPPTPAANTMPLIKNPLIPLGLLTGLYYSFNKFFKNLGLGTPSPLEAKVMEFPLLLPALVGAASYGAVKAQRHFNTPQYEFNKQAGTPNYWLERALVSFPGTFIYSGYQETKRQRGEQLNSAQDFVRKNPLLSSLGVFWGGGKLLKHSKNLVNKYAELLSELKIEDFEEIYEKIVI